MKTACSQFMQLTVIAITARARTLELQIKVCHTHQLAAPAFTQPPITPRAMKARNDTRAKGHKSVYLYVFSETLQQGNFRCSALLVLAVQDKPSPLPTESWTALACDLRGECNRPFSVRSGMGLKATASWALQWLQTSGSCQRPIVVFRKFATPNLTEF